MKPSILFVSALSLLSVISATVEEPTNHVGGIDGKRRYLGKKKKDDAKDEVKALLTCEKIEEFYYNALITIEDKSKDSVATSRCSDDDLVEIGKLIHELVLEIDKTFPPYEGGKYCNLVYHALT